MLMDGAYVFACRDPRIRQLIEARHDAHSKSTVIVKRCATIDGSLSRPL
jgi:hypothetical protein